MKSPSLMRISWWKSLHLTSAPPSVEQQSRKVSGGDRCTSGRDQPGGASSLESFVWPPLPTTLTHKSTHYAPHPPQTTSYQAHINPNSTPSCYRRPSKRTTSGLQTRNPWRTSQPTSLRSMTFKSTSSTKRLNDKPSLLVDPQMTSSHQWLWSIKVQQINKI